MKNLFFFTLIALLFCKVGMSQSQYDCPVHSVVVDSASSFPVVNPEYKPGWHILHQDEFNVNNTFDTYFWDAANGWWAGTWYGGTLNVEISNGTCKLISRYETKNASIDGGEISPDFIYTGGWFRSKAEYGPGYFGELRCKRAHKRFWSSYWTFTDKPFGMPRHNEIDIFDNGSAVSPPKYYDETGWCGAQKQILFNVMQEDTIYNSCDCYPLKNNLPPQDEQWYTYSFDYQTNYLKGYLNNQLILHRSAYVPQYSQVINFCVRPLIFDNYQMQQWALEGHPNGILEVDYFRMYKKNYEVQSNYTDFGTNQGWTDQNVRPRLLADINGDGKLDIIGFGFDYVQSCLSIPGTRDISFGTKQYSVSDYTVEQGWTNQNERPRMMANLDYDNKADIVGFGFGGVYVSLSQSTSQYVSFLTPNRIINDYSVEQGWSNQSLRPRFLSDINGDGRDDIVGFGYEGVYASLSNSDNGTPAFSTPDRYIQWYSVENGFPNQETTPRMLADVNGDGKNDIVGFRNDGVYVSLSTSTNNPSFGTLTKVLNDFGIDQDWTSQNLRPRFLADVNGDKKADIVGFGYGGVYVSLSTSTALSPSFLSPIRIIENFSVENGYSDLLNYPRYVCDINNDSKADIVAFNDSIIQIAISNSKDLPHFFNPNNVIDDFTKMFGWTNNDNYPRFFCDVNGDGPLDLIGFSSFNVSSSQDLGGVYNVPFNIYSSNKGKADNWSIQGQTGRDLTYKFYLEYASTVYLTTNYPETTINTTMYLFNENGTSTGYYSLNKSTPICANLQSGYYYLVIEGNQGVVGDIKMTAGKTCLGVVDPTDDLKSSETQGPNSTQVNNSLSIFLYPNPATNTLTVEASNEVNSEIQISNLVGSVVKNSFIKGTQVKIDISYLPEGVYFLNLRDDQLKPVIKKFVISR